MITPEPTHNAKVFARVFMGGIRALLAGRFKGDSVLVPTMKLEWLVARAWDAGNASRAAAKADGATADALILAGHRLREAVGAVDAKAQPGLFAAASAWDAFAQQREAQDSAKASVE